MLTKLDLNRGLCLSPIYKDLSNSRVSVLCYFTLVVVIICLILVKNLALPVSFRVCMCV